MERTRDEVVRILHDRGASSVAEVAEEVGVSAGAVRRHLDLMIAEGLVEQRLERQPRGRPVTRYFLSEEGEERSAAAHYHRLLERIYPALSRRVEVESGFEGEVHARARSMGYLPVPPAFGYARVYLIARRGGQWVAAADPRHDGQARAY